MLKISSFLSELRAHPAGFCSLILLCVLYFFAIFAPFFAPYETDVQNLKKSYHPPMFPRLSTNGFFVHNYIQDEEDLSIHHIDKSSRMPLKLFAKGYSYHLFGLIPMDRHLILPDTNDPEARFYFLGADSLGRDVFSRLLYGSQVSLFIGIIGITITMVIGFLVGGVSGYFGGKIDFLAMRIVELLMAIPGLYLLLALRSALAPYFPSEYMFLVIVVVLSLIGWAGTARIIRGLSLSLSQRTFILASRSMGQSTFNILLKHILPNLTSYLLVAATLSIPGYILGEAALSFLGLGIQEPASSWGLMLKQAQQMKVFMLNFWWILSPGFMIFITVVAFNLLGDALRDIVDPKMKT